MTGVLWDNGRELTCEMVCIGKGVVPNAKFLETSGVEIDAGVVVNRFTETQAPGIHAAGDVAVTFDPITGERIVTGLWTKAVEMGRCVGSNMAGQPVEYIKIYQSINQFEPY